MADPVIAARAEIIREKGTNRSAFLRGEVDKYTWVDEGSSYIQSDVLAAILDAQLDKLPEIQRRRRAISRRYRERLAGWAERDGRAASRRAARPREQRPPVRAACSRTARRGPVHGGAPEAPRGGRHLPLHPAALLALLDAVRGIGAAPCPSPIGWRRRSRGCRSTPGSPTRTSTRVIAAVHERPGLSAAAVPDLSVVIACYNEEETLERSFAEIREVLEDMRRPYEIVFVDDVSRDRDARHPGRPRRRPSRDGARPAARANTGPRRRPSPTGSGWRGARSPASSTSTSRCTPATSRRWCKAIERGADVATRAPDLRLPAAVASTATLMSRGYSFLVRRLLGVDVARHRDRLQVLPPRAACCRSSTRSATPAGSGTPSSWCAPRAAACAIAEIPGAYIRRFDKTSTVSGVRDSVRYFGKLVRVPQALRAAPPR